MVSNDAMQTTSSQSHQATVVVVVQTVLSFFFPAETHVAAPVLPQYIDVVVVKFRRGS